MNLEYLGDAFDHWKGSLISILRPRLICPLTVVPMATDAGNWTPEDWQAYRRLLHLGRADIICELPFAAMRDGYFEGVSRDRDIFLDPDTGIATGNARRKHVEIQELNGLLNGSKNRLLMIYQHSARNNFHLRLVDIAGHVQENIQGSHFAVYECRQVAMFFISLDRKRIRDIGKALRAYLIGTANWRIWDP